MREKLGKSHRRKRKTGQGGKHRIIAAAALVPAVTALIAAAVFLIYVSVYYRADAAAEEALRTDEVLVEKTDYGWYFDGPSEDTALIFYPGGKVEYTSYSPLMKKLAQEGIFCVLLKMPAMDLKKFLWSESLSLISPTVTSACELWVTSACASLT